MLTLHTVFKINITVIERTLRFLDLQQLWIHWIGCPLRAWTSLHLLSGDWFLHHSVPYRYRYHYVDQQAVKQPHLLNEYPLVALFEASQL